MAAAVALEARPAPPAPSLLRRELSDGGKALFLEALSFGAPRAPALPEPPPLEETLGALPPALIQLKAEADTDLSDYQAVAVDTTSAKTEMDCTRHNKAIRDAAAKKKAAGETLLSSIRNLKNGVAQDLIEAMSPRARCGCAWSLFGDGVSG